MEVFHLYEFRLQNSKLRDPLVNYLRKNNIDAKIHYPIPMHLQPAAKKYGYKKGDFPISEKASKEVMSIPMNAFLTNHQDDYVISKIQENM